MKVNKKIMHAAVVHAALELGSIKDLADNVASSLKGVEVYNIKNDGFILRQGKNNEIDYDDLTKAITEGICEILDEDLENSMDYIQENYEFIYNSDHISPDYIRELFDYNRNGRLIYVEIDM